MKKLPPVVFALGFVSLFTDIASDMIVPVLPVFLTVTLGASATFFGLVEGVAEVVAALLKGMGGVWSDHSGGGRKKWLVGGYTLSSLARPLIALVAAPWQVLVLRGVDRVGKGLRTAPRDAMLTAAVSEGERGRAFGFHRAMDHTGALLGGLLASALLAWGLTEQQVIGWSIVPGVLAILAVIILVKEPAQEPAELSKQRKDAWSFAVLTPELRRFLPVVGLFALANSSDAFLLLKAKETGIPAVQLPLLWAWIHVARILANYYGGGLADRFGARRTVGIGWLCFAVAYALTALSAQPWQVWAILGFYGLYNGLTEGGVKVIVSQLSRADARGASFGAFHLVTGVIALPASLLTGWLWDIYGSTTAFITCAVIATLSSLLLLLSQKKHT